MKRCTECGLEKPLSAFYLEKGKPRAKCKDCHRAAVYARRKADPARFEEQRQRSDKKNRERIRRRDRERWPERREKENARKRERQATPEYRAKERAHWAANREAISERRRADWAANPEKGRAALRAYRAGNLERIRERERRYRAANREKVNASNREYYAKNSEKWVAHRRKREARKAAVEWQPYTRREIYDRDGGKCQACGKALPYAPRAFQIDHIVPISLGGPDIPSNLQLMCPSCNRRKWANLEGQLHFAA